MHSSRDRPNGGGRRGVRAREKGKGEEREDETERGSVRGERGLKW